VLAVPLRSPAMKSAAGMGVPQTKWEERRTGRSSRPALLRTKERWYHGRLIGDER